ncbi:hypothetical protein B0H21DRAFT_711868, partial [Amylocystis lapponica]
MPHWPPANSLGLALLPAGLALRSLPVASRWHLTGISCWPLPRAIRLCRSSCDLMFPVRNISDGIARSEVLQKLLRLPLPLLYEEPEMLVLRDDVASMPADGAGAAPVAKRPNVQMPDEYLPPNKILFLLKLPESCVLFYSALLRSGLAAAWASDWYLHKVCLIPTKHDIVFMEFFDEGGATVAKDVPHNDKLDGENKIR